MAKSSQPLRRSSTISRNSRNTELEDALARPFSLDDYSELDSGLVVPKHIVGESSRGFIGDDEDTSQVESNLARMWDEILTKPNPVPPDLVVDDRDLKEFPNFYSFVTDREESKIGTPFPRQLWMLTQILCEACPGKKCTSPDWWDIDKVPLKVKSIDSLLDMVTFYEHGVCPNCKGRRSEHARKKRIKIVSEVFACLGQRAGKSMSLSWLSAYILHKWLKMQSPTRALGLIRGSIITGKFVALTFQRANNLLWMPLNNIVSASNWFTKYHELLDDVGARKGIELYKKPGGITLHYKHRDIVWSPSGPSHRTLRGDTGGYYVVDEAGIFPIDGDKGGKERERLSIWETAKSLKNSLMTVRRETRKRLRDGNDNITQAIGVYISSPKSQRDFIMRGVRENANNPRSFVLHKPTWEFNPKMTYKFLKSEYRNDPMGLERDFGANPPMSENPFFDTGGLDEKIFSGVQNKVAYLYKTERDPRKPLKQKWAEPTRTNTAGLIPVSIMGFDAGEVSNSFSVSIAHLEETKIPGGVRRTIKVDAIIEVAPTERVSQINFTRMADALIFPLIKKFNVGALVSDRWQNKKLLSDAQQVFKKLVVENYSLKYADLLDFKDNMLDHTTPIILPRLEISIEEIQKLDVGGNYPHCFKYIPVAHTWYQLQTVQDTGKQVVKGGGLTDDNLRSIMILSHFLLDVEWCRKNLKGASLQSGGLIAASSRGDVHSGLNGQSRDPIRTVSGIGAIASKNSFINRQS